MSAYKLNKLFFLFSRIMALLQLLSSKYVAVGPYL